MIVSDCIQTFTPVYRIRTCEKREKQSGGYVGFPRPRQASIAWKRIQRGTRTNGLLEQHLKAQVRVVLQTWGSCSLPNDCFVHDYGCVEVHGWRWSRTEHSIKLAH